MTKPTSRHNARGCCTLLIVGITSTLQAGAVETLGRYSLVNSGPTIVHRDPLTAPVSSQFADSVTTVGQAVDTALLPTGYRLAPALHADPERGPLLNLPLPSVDRDFSGVSVRRALEALIGPAFRLVEDPVHRLVSFERCGPTGSAVALPGQTPSW